MISDVDEWLHTPDTDDADWADEVTFTATDDAASVLLHVVGRVLPNRPGAEAAWVLWRPHLAPLVVEASEASIPPHNWDVMAIGPAGFRMEAARTTWTLHLDGPDVRAFLTFAATGDCRLVDGGAGYVQDGTVRGDVQLDAGRIAVDARAHRSHRWGAGAAGALTLPLGDEGDPVEAAGRRLTPTDGGLVVSRP